VIRLFFAWVEGVGLLLGILPFSLPISLLFKDLCYRGGLG